AGAAAANADLIGYWSFDGTLEETSGFTPAGTHDAEIGTGDPTFSTDTPSRLGGMSMFFDGNDALRVRNSNANVLINQDGTGGNDSQGPNPTYRPTFSRDLDEVGTGLTIAAWVKIDPRMPPVQNDWEPYISKLGEGQSGYQLRRRGDSNNSTFTLRGTQGDDDPQGVITTADGEWNFIVGVWNQGDPNDPGNDAFRKLYVNGVEDTGVTQSGDFGEFRPGETNDLGGHGNADWEFLAFGGRDQGSWSTTRVWLDEIRMYNRAITESEVQALFAIPEPTTATMLAATIGLFSLPWSRCRGS
ncbi:MAG: LamG-like jellyroll fold domain-containing protein, partial [Planctomycetota bacterium]